MKQYQYIRHNRISRIISATAQCRILKVAFVLIVVLFQISATAQFIRINLDIPTKTGQTELVPFNFSLQSDINGTQMLGGTSVLCISGAENLQVQATLSHSDFLRSEMGDALKLNASLAFRNDGISKPPGINTGQTATFPLSNSRLIIQSIKNYPDVLNAFIFIHATAELPPSTKYTYEGDINLKIEYN